jgi:hypothetical protein
VKAPLAVIAVMAVALAVAGVAVFGLNDRTTLVPPPEAEAETVMRSLATRRYTQALPRLSDELRRSGTDGLRRRQREIEQAHGRVRDVQGERSSIAGDYAEASVRLTTEAGETVLRFRLLRRHGEWRVASLGE